MLKHNTMIMESEQYRILNLLREKRLSNKLLAETLNLSKDKIAYHLKTLHANDLITCDLNSPLDQCRIDKTFINENPLFYAFASNQMDHSPIYQNDIAKLQELLFFVL